MGIESISLLHSCVNLHLSVKPKYEKVQGRHGLLSHFVTCCSIESMQFFIVAFFSVKQPSRGSSCRISCAGQRGMPYRNPRRTDAATSAASCSNGSQAARERGSLGTAASAQTAPTPTFQRPRPSQRTSALRHEANPASPRFHSYAVGVRLFGTVQEPSLSVVVCCFGFHGLFFRALLFGSGLSPFNRKSTRSRVPPWE